MPRLRSCPLYDITFASGLSFGGVSIDGISPEYGVLPDTRIAVGDREAFEESHASGSPTVERRRFVFFRITEIADDVTHRAFCR